MKVRDDQEPPMKKLAIQVPSDEELYDYAASFKCFRCPEGESQFKDEPRVSFDVLRPLLASISLNPSLRVASSSSLSRTGS